nr:hypothetical protein [Synechococcus sp. LTW-R]
MNLRRIHRVIVPVAAVPLLITSLSGSVYSGLLDQGIDAFWLLKLHTGRFGPINLQPYYSVILGLLKIALIVSSVSLFLPKRRSLKTSE